MQKIGVFRCYVDESLNGGKEKFIKLMDATVKKIEFRALIFDCFDLYGTLMEKMIKNTVGFSGMFCSKYGLRSDGCNLR